MTKNDVKVVTVLVVATVVLALSVYILVGTLSLEYTERPAHTIDPKYRQAVWEYKTMKVAKRIKEIENEQGK